jgi:hypothetical protein
MTTIATKSIPLDLQFFIEKLLASLRAVCPWYIAVKGIVYHTAHEERTCTGGSMTLILNSTFGVTVVL